MASLDPPSSPGSSRGEPPAQPPSPLQFSLETLLLLTTLIAVCLGTLMSVPPLGIPLSVIALGGVIRTVIIARQRQRAGAPFGAAEKMAEFVISCSTVVGALMIGLIVMAAIGCVGMFGSIVVTDIVRNLEFRGAASDVASRGLVVLFLTAALVGPLAAAGWFLWATRPR